MIHHYEALMRLKDENGKIYSPYAFLEVARTYGLLYDALSMAMLKKVFDAFRDSEDKSVSINLGMLDIKNEELTGYIYGFPAAVPQPGYAGRLLRQRRLRRRAVRRAARAGQSARQGRLCIRI